VGQAGVNGLPLPNGKGPDLRPGYGGGTGQL